MYLITPYLIGRFDHIQNLVDFPIFAHWLKTEKSLDLNPFDQRYVASQLLRQFFLSDGIDPAQWDASEFK